MADATALREADSQRRTLTAAAAAGEIQQQPDGSAAFLDGSVGAASGEYPTFRTRIQATVTKATGFVGLDGGRAYWDHSANAATYKKVNDRDFYLGRFVGDSASSDTTCTINLLRDPEYDSDLSKDGFSSVLVGTGAAVGFGYPVNLGGSLVFELDATNEAQKVDALGLHGFAVGANAIIEGAFRVISDGSGSNTDVSIGVANATHASDADSITESLFIHLDGNDVNIKAESDDGTTEVAATDTTIDYTEGSTIGQRIEFWMDTRNPADVQIYINGSLVLPATVFNISAATGPLFPLVHVEKTASTDTYKIAIDWLRVRTQE